MADKLMLICHGEKPTAPDSSGRVTSCGLLENGEQSVYGLTVRGWQRAGALAILFGPEGAGFRPESLVMPQVIFASGIGPHSRSLRMQQTITPLREKLGPAVSINIEYRKGQEEAMVEAAVQSAGANVLICWSHEGIPLIAAKILGEANQAPQAWPEERYDLVWVFDRSPGLRNWTFHQVPQMLLSGDLIDIIS